MNEYTSPELVPPQTAGNLTDIIVTNAEEAPDKVVFSRRIEGEWRDVTCRQFLGEVQAVAKGLVAAGIQPGDRVGLMSRTRYEWTLVDFAIWFAGAITVPIYETSSAEQVQWILNDSAAVGVFLETAKHVEILAEVRDYLPGLDLTWVFDDGAVDALVASGGEITDDAIEQRRTSAAPGDIATIIYTSGTTGRPKGCELSHSNFLFEVGNIVSLDDPSRMLAAVFADGDASTLLFLPLAHVFARSIQIGVVMARGRLAHTADVKNLMDDLAEFKPTFILSVPRVFEKIYNSAALRAEAAGKGKIFQAAVDTAIAYSEALQQGRVSVGLRVKHRVFDRLVYAKVRAVLGGNIQWVVSGGAPLGERLGHFYRGVGMTVLEGYGLTETAAGTTLNTPSHLKIGTVGQPLPGTTLRIAEDGEVLVKGGQVFLGYFGNDAASIVSKTGGWFHTGDIGEIDSDGFLRITGRKKEIIVTASGKNVAPAVLEDRLRAHLLVSQCMVVGDAQPFIACLVTLDEEALTRWLPQHGKEPMILSAAAADADVLAEVQRAVDDANKAVSRAEAIKKFAVLDVDFTEENGALTPTLKLKRDVVMKQYAGDVDALYS